MEIEEECISRHKKEKKELQAHIQQLKHTVPKGDKKKKKEVTAQIAVLEAELESRHEQELTAFKSQTKTENATSEAVSELSNLAAGSVNADADAGDGPAIDETVAKKPSKAQRRKDKKAQKAQEREEQIKEQDVLNKQSSRQVEADKLKVILRSRGLVLSEIPADGNCLFSAIEDQLRQQNVESCVTTLRHQTADYMRSHRDDFCPFLIHEATGELYSEDEFDQYCERLEKTPMWGGQAEIRALSEVLKLPIEVIQAEGPSVTVGDHFCNAASSLKLVYHRHIYRLGEHYNSVRTLTNTTENTDS